MSFNFQENKNFGIAGLQNTKQANNVPIKANFLMRWGIAKDEKSASNIMLGIAAIFFAISIFVTFKYVL